MKVRIYKTGEEVVVDTPAMRYQDKVEECPHPGRFRDGKESFTMEVKELSEIEAMAVDNEAGSAQFYYEGDTLKHDSDRSELLMHVGEIKSKHRKRLERKLDTELDKPTPDPVEVVRLQRAKEKVKEKTEKEAYEQALENLIEDGHDKPKIKAKLEAKIAELK